MGTQKTVRGGALTKLCILGLNGKYFGLNTDKKAESLNCMNILRAWQEKMVGNALPTLWVVLGY